MADRSIFRYMSSKYVDGFVSRGEVLFRSLSYYRDYEADEGVRSDEYEGTHAHRPEGGLVLTMQGDGRQVQLGEHRFESTAKQEDDIFVSCMSSVLSRDIGSRFGADACVEITWPGKFRTLLHNQLVKEKALEDPGLIHGRIRYYDQADPSGIEWALPEKIALSKFRTFDWQKEYRFAFGINGAFAVENVETRIVTPADRGRPRRTDHPMRVVAVGDLSRICKVHTF